MNGLIIPGIILLAIGCAGIAFVTIPSVTNIVEVADSAMTEEEVTTNQIVGGVISGFFLWFTTGVFISLTVGGVLLTFAGFAD